MLYVPLRADNLLRTHVDGTTCHIPVTMAAAELMPTARRADSLLAGGPGCPCWTRTMSTWEYCTERVRADSAGIDSLAPMLNSLGAVGWEVVGFTAGGLSAADALVVVLKRQSLPPVPPNDRSPDWKLDPLGRHELRYWDGLRWTEHVSDQSRTFIDSPILE